MNLPEGWANAAIEELIPADGVFIDGDWVESKDQDPDGEVRLIQLADVGDGVFRNKSARFLNREAAARLRCTFLKKGDLLVARMPDPLGRACVFPLEGESRFVTVVDVCIIRTSEDFVSPGFFQSAINFLGTRKKINDLQTGSTRKRISRKNLATVTFPLPPLNEQKRIVAKIEELFSELDAGEESLRQARRQLGIYRQSLLKQAFEGKLTAQWRKQNPDLLESPDQLLARIDKQREAHYQLQVSEWTEALKKWQKGSKKDSKPTKPKTPKVCRNEETRSHDSLPLGWVRTRLGQIIEEPAYGTSKKCSYDFDGVGVLRIPNIDNGRIDASDLKFASFTDTEISQYGLKEGDLLMIRSNGSVSIVGTCGLISAAASQFLYAGYLIRLRPIPLTIDPEFLIYFIGSHDARTQIEGVAKSSSGVNNINTGEIQSIGFSICSLPEQQEIVRLLDEQFTVIEQNERELDAALKRSEALRQSILKKAFTGHLVPQDPTDEPAKELIARIHAEREFQDATAKPRKKDTLKKTKPR